MKASKKKLILIVLSVTVFLCAACLISFFAINAYVSNFALSYIKDASDEGLRGADCIIVLGAGITADGKPSAILLDRLNRARQLYEAGVSERLLMSGDHGRESYNEVAAMKDYALEHEIEASHIFMDHAGFSTYDTIARAKSVFMAQKVVIVTQEYHLYRAVYIARKLGLEAYGVASDYKTGDYTDWYEFREKFARVKDFFMCLLSPEPRYLGEAVPVSADGSVTEDRQASDFLR